MKKLLFILSLSFTAVTNYSIAQNVTCNPQCVAYARSRVPSCPTGLISYQNKLDIRNEYSPMAGTVAIINVNNNQYGHVAFVSNYLNGEVTLEETNWLPNCAYGTRKGTPAGLNIVGYFRPIATSSSPAVGTYVTCPLTENGSCGNATGNTVKMKVQSLNNGKATFAAAKCNGNFTQNGTFYIKEGGLCGQIIAQQQFANGSSAVSLSCIVVKGRTYHGLIISSDATRFYAGKISFN
jgi:hypothetical protein